MKRRIAYTLGAQSFGQLVTIAIQIISVPVFIHGWGVKLYGEWLVLSAIPSYLLLSDMGFSAATANTMTIRVAAGDREGALESFQSCLLLIVCIQVLIGIPMLVGIHWLDIKEWLQLNTITADNVTLIVTLLVLSVFMRLPNELLGGGYRSVGRFAEAIFISNALRLCESLVCCVAVLVGYGPITIVLIGLTIHLIGFFCITLRPWLSFGIKLSHWRSLRELISPAIGFALFPLANALNIQGMVFIINLTLGAGAVVVFSTLRTLTRLATSVVNIVNNSIMPELSIAFGQKDLLLAGFIFTTATKTTFWLSLLIAVFMYLTGDFILTQWLHGHVIMDKPVFAMLLALVISNAIWQTSMISVASINKHKSLSIANLFIAIINIDDFDNSTKSFKEFKNPSKKFFN